MQEISPVQQIIRRTSGGATSRTGARTVAGRLRVRRSVFSLPEVFLKFPQSSCLLHQQGWAFSLDQNNYPCKRFFNLKLKINTHKHKTIRMIWWWPAVKHRPLLVTTGPAANNDVINGLITPGRWVITELQTFQFDPKFIRREVVLFLFTLLLVKNREQK